MNKYTGFDGFEDMRCKFEAEPWRGTTTKLDISDEDVLVAVYIEESYEGAAFILFEKDGQLYEVNGSHCSCAGLEGQWRPELTTKEAIIARRKGLRGHSEVDCALSYLNWT